jgi:hypothetical protein
MPGALTLMALFAIGQLKKGTGPRLTIDLTRPQLACSEAEITQSAPNR